MATERSRGSARSTTPENSATMGVVLVVVALVVGIFLLVKGGGDATDETSAGSRPGGSDSPAETTTTAAPPSTVPIAQLEIIAANGSGKKGRAADTKAVLNAAGYQVVNAVDGTPTDTTFVYFIPDAQADAAGVAAALTLPAERVQPMPPTAPLKDDPIGTTRVLVLIGPDFDPATIAAPATSAGG